MKDAGRGERVRVALVLRCDAVLFWRDIDMPPLLGFLAGSSGWIGAGVEPAVAARLRLRVDVLELVRW